MPASSAASAASADEWEEVLGSKSVLKWTADDCCSVMSALTSGTIEEDTAGIFWKRMEKAKYKATRKKLGEAAGHLFLQAASGASSSRSKSKNIKKETKPKREKKEKAKGAKSPTINKEMPPNFRVVYENKQLFEAQVDLCGHLNADPITGAESPETVLTLKQSQRPSLLLAVGDARPGLVVLHGIDKYQGSLLAPSEWDGLFFAFQNETRNGNLPPSTEIDKMWFERKEVPITSMEAFEKALKNTDPGQRLVTTGDSKTNNVITPGAIWIPSLFAKDLLTVKRSVPAVWELWHHAAKSLPQAKQAQLAPLWSYP